MPVKTKRSSKKQKTSKLYRFIPKTRRAKSLTVIALIALVGGVVMVFQTFAITDPMKQTNEWIYTIGNESGTAGLARLETTGVCAFTSRVINEPAKNSMKVAAIKCDKRDEGSPDSALVYTRAPVLAAWSAGKYYQACFWVAGDTPVGIRAGQRPTVMDFNFGMTDRGGWSIGGPRSVQYMPSDNPTYNEYCTLSKLSNGATRNLLLEISSQNDSSFRVGRIVLKEFVKKNSDGKN